MKASDISLAAKSLGKNGARKTSTGDAAWTGSIHVARQDNATSPIRLTPRECEVLALLCEGLPNKLIGRRLQISSGTVKVHVSNILRALNVANRLQAVLLARRWELTHDFAIYAEPGQHIQPGRHR